MKVAVVAFGGNALMDFSGKSSYAEQMMKADKMCREILSLFNRGYTVVITHGNGPQVGNLLMQQESLADNIPPMPLDVCDAMTQGQIGYMIEQSLRNMFTKNGIKKSVVSLVTQVVVSEDDPAFKNPTKFIGPFFNKDEIEELERGRGWQVREDSGRGWRRVVPSPKPVDIVEKDEIREMIMKNFVVISCGGGGIPVLRDKKGVLKGVSAVIDKDFAAERLASLIDAEILLLITSVSQVSIFYGTPKQKTLGRITLDEAKRYWEEGHFPPGSMGPKIEAAIRFLDSGGKKTIITSLEGIEAAIKGEGGTEIVA
ncbi:MAG TPA: carbamate kinase [Thermodesulfobacteriota bacterium]|nr:carbamate kinase [Thermodesulfobacteriota bacterium]